MKVLKSGNVIIKHEGFAYTMCCEKCHALLEITKGDLVTERDSSMGYGKVYCEFFCVECGKENHFTY